MRFRAIPEWLLAIFLAVVFLFAGSVKLISSQAMVREFAQIGAGQWLRYLTGLLEVGGAIGLLIPKFRIWAALLLACVMAGATGVNLFVLHIPPLARVTAVLMALALLVAWLCRLSDRPSHHPQPESAR